MFQELGKTNSFMMSFFPIIITKEILERNVAFNFGKIIFFYQNSQNIGHLYVIFFI